VARQAQGTLKELLVAVDTFAHHHARVVARDNGTSAEVIRKDVEATRCGLITRRKT
jgi:hypothetical protein